MYRVRPAFRIDCRTLSCSMACALCVGQSVSPGRPSWPQVRHGLRNLLIVLTIEPRYRREQSSPKLSRSLRLSCQSFLFACPSSAFELNCWCRIHLQHYRATQVTQWLVSGIYSANEFHFDVTGRTFVVIEWHL